MPPGLSSTACSVRPRPEVAEGVDVTASIPSRLSAVLTDLPRQGLLGVVRGYRLLLKPWLGNACRFEPTCSQYALTALERHGALAGGALAAGRLLRCHPWCPGGCSATISSALLMARMPLSSCCT